jgi:hypothetical protein
MTHAGVSYQPLQIRLREGHHGTVNDPNRCQPQGYGSEFMSGIRKERDNESDQPVGASFSSNPARITLPAVGASV